MRARHEEEDETGRDEEARGVDPERRRRAEPGYEDAAERRAQELRALLDAGANAGGALHSDAGELDDVRKEGCPRGRARGVEQRAEEHEQHELPDLDPHGCIEQRDGCDGRRARKVGDDARRTEPEPVDDDAAEEGCEHDREEVEEDDERGQGRAPRRRQDEPGDRNLRDGIA